MRPLALGAALFAAISLCSLPAGAFVKPEPGSVLPDYDLRKDPSALAGLDRSEQVQGGRALLAEQADEAGKARFLAVEPSLSQRLAFERLRSAVASDLKVDYNQANGLPRQLHAWGRPLSAASSDDPVLVVRAFLLRHAELFRLTASEIDALQVVRNYPTGSVMRTVWLGQAVDGVLVDRGELRFALDAQQRVVWVSAGDLQPGLRISTVPGTSAEQAVRSAAQSIGRSLEGGLELRSSLGSSQVVFRHPDYLGNIIVEPAIFPVAESGSILAWQVRLEPANVALPAWYVITVDGRSGKLLARTNLYKYATNKGLAFEGEYPNTLPNPPFEDGVPQTTVDFGYRWPSTVGWTVPAPYGLYNLTIGNNVDAKEDWLGDNETSIGGHADGGPLQEFLFPFQDAYEKSTGATVAAKIADGKLDLPAAATNLFYSINNWHDYTHRLGFDEAAGNFQMDNFSRGGCGKDAVYGDVQDRASPPSGTPSLNNANFGTPPESLTCSGTIDRPRMQMFMWTAQAYRDGDFDNSVIIHEYHHGVSIRLVGGPYVGCMGGTQSGAIGEGGGDWESASYHDHPVTGAYAWNDPVSGIRTFPMDANPRTYADLCGLGGCQVHADGEIHASVMWDHRQRMGQAVTEQLAMDAYKLSPCGPSFLDYRDALLLADSLRYGGAHFCDIWEISQARAMGFDALGADSAYHVPDFVFNHPRCSGWAHLRYNAHTASDVTGGNGDGLYALGETVDLNVELQNFDGAATAAGVSATVSSVTPGITLITANRSYPDIPAGGKANPTAPFQFRIDPGYVCGVPIDFSVQMAWSPGATRADDFVDASGSTSGILLFADDAEGAPGNIAAPMAVSTAQNHSAGGSKSYYTLAGCYAGDESTCTGAGACNDTCPMITLPSMTLPTNQAAVLSFWATYNNEYNWDGIYAEISEDGGLTWSSIPTLNFNGTLPAQNPLVGCDNGVDEPGVTGPPVNDKLEPWTRIEGHLAAWAGKAVSIRIREHHDFCVYFEGAYIDDIQVAVQNCTSAPFVDTFLSGKSNNDGVNAACTDNDLSPDPGETVDTLLMVTNSGNSAANSATATLSSTNPGISVLSGPQSLGSLNPGQSASVTFQYTVANPGPACFEVADFNLAISANGGSFNDNIGFTEILRRDNGTASWTDNFEGGKAPWTPSLGPAGSAQDWALRELDCLSTGGNRWFWATNVGMVPAICATGEPDYSNDSDSVLTSPLMDLGAPGMRLLRASWSTYGIGSNVSSGFIEVLVDHDNDGTFTQLWSTPDLGAVNAAQGYSLDIQDNPAGSPVSPATTAQFVRFQFRLRSTAPDPGNGADSRGLLVDSFAFEWELCDVNACAPGSPSRRGMGGIITDTTTGAVNGSAEASTTGRSGASLP